MDSQVWLSCLCWRNLVNLFQCRQKKSLKPLCYQILKFVYPVYVGEILFICLSISKNILEDSESGDSYPVIQLEITCYQIDGSCLKIVVVRERLVKFTVANNALGALYLRIFPVHDNVVALSVKQQ